MSGPSGGLFALPGERQSVTETQRKVACHAEGRTVAVGDTLAPVLVIGAPFTSTLPCARAARVKHLVWAAHTSLRRPCVRLPRSIYEGEHSRCTKPCASRACMIHDCTSVLLY